MVFSAMNFVEKYHLKIRLFYICIMFIWIVCQYLYEGQYVYMLACICVHMCVYVYANMLEYMWTFIHVYVYANICIACAYGRYI